MLRYWLRSLRSKESIRQDHVHATFLSVTARAIDVMAVIWFVLLRRGRKILFDYMWLYCHHPLFVIAIGYSNTFHVCEYHGYCELLQRMVGV